MTFLHIFLYVVVTCDVLEMALSTAGLTNCGRCSTALAAVLLEDAGEHPAPQQGAADTLWLTGLCMPMPFLSTLL